MPLAFAVLAFNHNPLTILCLRSLLDGRFKISQEQIFLYHNGSETKNIDELKNLFPHIHHLVSPENLGFAGGCNQLFTEIFKHYDWAVFLSSDTELLQLESTLPVQSGLYAPLIYKRKTQQLDSFGATINLSKAQLRHHRQATPLSPEHFYVPGASFLIHRDFFQQSDGFDSKLFCYWEDVDLSLRAKKLNLHLGQCQSIKVKHKIGKTSKGHPLFTVYYYQRNRITVCWRHLAGQSLQKLIFLLCVATDLGQILFLYLMKRDGVRLNYLKKAIKDGITFLRQ